jgi:hypothetical protein
MVRKTWRRTKIEADGRMFPFRILHKPLLIVSKANTKTGNRSTQDKAYNRFSIEVLKTYGKSKPKLKSILEKLILATGTILKYGKCYRILVTLSVSFFLFTFNIKDSRIKELPVAQVTVTKVR